MLLILLEISRMSCGTWAGADEICWLGRNFGSPLAAETRFRQRITSHGQLPVSIIHTSIGEFFHSVMVVAFFSSFLSPH